MALPSIPCHPRARLKVLIVGGKLHAPGDFYCTCEIENRPAGRIRTDLVKQTREPVWTFMGDLDGCDIGDALLFRVIDLNRETRLSAGKQDSRASTAKMVNGKSNTRSLSKSMSTRVVESVLGTATLDYMDFYVQGFDSTLPLYSAGGEDVGTVDVKVLSQPAQAPDEYECRLFVQVDKASGLDCRGDPYCIVQIPEKPFRMQTKIGGFQNKNPRWEEADELPDYKPGDPLEFKVYDYAGLGEEAQQIGRALLTNFHPNGFDGTLPLGTEDKGVLKVDVQVVVPPPSDPGAEIGPGDRYDVPFQLRSLDTGRAHTLAAFTLVGRSGSSLNPSIDLVLDTPGCTDVSRKHAVIKVWQSPDGASWYARVYSISRESGVNLAPGGGHAGGGTCVNNEPVDMDTGAPLEIGDVVRFGVRELWVLERAGLNDPSRKAEKATSRVSKEAAQDPTMVRSVLLSTQASFSAAQRCSDWISLVRVVLEINNEPDELPCADVIEVRDECSQLLTRHEAGTVEAQEKYDVQDILREVRLGMSLQIHLSSDPCLLAPVLQQLEGQQAKMSEVYSARQNVL